MRRCQIDDVHFYTVLPLLFASVLCQLGALTMPAGTELLQLLVFATVVSAVDPVAVLAVFEEISVNQVSSGFTFLEMNIN